MNESSGTRASGESPNKTSSAWDSLGDSAGNDGISMEDLMGHLKRMEEEPREDFAGERNINDGTGKKRTFSEFDQYPIMKGETPKKYGERLRSNHEKLAKFKEAQEQKDQASSDQKEGRDNDYYDRMTKKIDESQGLTEGHKKSLQELLDRRFKDKTPEDENNNSKEDSERIKKEAEARAKLEAEERAKREEEERKKIEDEEYERQREKERALLISEFNRLFPEEKRNGHTTEEVIDNLTEEERKQLLGITLHKEAANSKKPLFAINADFTHDRDELAHDLAERKLNQEASANWRSRLWKGTLFRSYYETKYTREFKEGAFITNEDGKKISVKNLIEERKAGAIERFILSMSDEYSEEARKNFIHSGAGEKLTNANAETTAAVKGVITKFASEWAKKNSTEFASIKNNKDIKREFQNEIDRVFAEMRDKGKKQNRAMFGNYFDVAIQAAEASAHFTSMDEVMEGFRVYNAEVRDGVRTEAHRKNIDKITNWVEKNSHGLFQPEVIAGAIGFAGALGKFGAQTAARATGIVGGIAFSSIASGIREHNRITGDRARMLRDAAEGVTYEGQNKSKNNNKTSRYEARIWGTKYDIKKASDLTAELNNAMSMENGEDRRVALLSAISNARVRIDYSDSERKDLISYSSADRRGQERLELDKATIRAEGLLSEEDKMILGAAKFVIKKEIEKKVSEQDEKFQHERAIMSLKHAGKTALIGTAVFFGSQEALALIDPNKIGLFEKYELVNLQNNTETAQETVLAHTVGSFVPAPVESPEIITGISGDRTEDIRRFEEQGYRKVETTPASSYTSSKIEDIDASEVPGTMVRYDGWANNGTSYSDGNELRLYIENGSVVSGMSGTSTMGNEIFNYAELASQGKIKGYLTIGDTKFEITPHLDASGRLAWGENGVFTTTTGETINSVLSGDNLTGKYFEIAVDRGIDADGIQHIIPLATEVGSNSFNGGMSRLVETVIEEPAIYSFIKEPVVNIRDVTYVGVPFGVSAHTGLGQATNPERATPRASAPPSNVFSSSSSAPSSSTSSTPPAPAPNMTHKTTPKPTPNQAPGSTPPKNESAPSESKPVINPSDQALSRARERARKENIPQKAVAFITEPNTTGPSVYTSEKAAEYRAWWDAQDEDTKSKVITIIKSIEKDPDFNSTRWGNSFRTWLHENHKEAFSN